MLRGDKTKQISITKSADKDRCKGSLVAILTSGQIFLFWNSHPKAAKVCQYPSSEEHCHPIAAAPGLNLSRGFSSYPNGPGFTLTYGHKLLQTETEGAPSCSSLWWEENFFSCQEGAGAATRQGRNAGLPWNFNRQCLQCHYGEIYSVYQV